MTVEHVKATIRGIDAVQGKGAGSNVKSLIVHRPVTAGASTGSTYTLGRFPSNARILSTISIFFTSGITSTSSSNIELGTFGDINGQNLSDDSNSLGTYNGNDTINSTSAISSIIPELSKAINGGKMLWELHNPGTLTKDPIGFFDVKATFLINMDTGGELGCEIFYLLN